MNTIHVNNLQEKMLRALKFTFFAGRIYVYFLCVYFFWNPFYAWIWCFSNMHVGINNEDRNLWTLSVGFRGCYSTRSYVFLKVSPHIYQHVQFVFWFASCYYSTLGFHSKGTCLVKGWFPPNIKNFLHWKSRNVNLKSYPKMGKIE